MSSIFRWNPCLITKSGLWWLPRIRSCAHELIHGLWQCMDYSPHTLSLVKKLVDGGRILQFGCGTGDLIYVLPPSIYSDYLGIDISSAAIAKAKKLTAEIESRTYLTLVKSV